MREIELPVPTSDAEAAIEAAAAALGLVPGSKGGLKKYPGCMHWHFKHPGQRGTLEVTLWEGRLWAKVHPLRDAPWIDEAIEGLRRELGCDL